MSVIYFYIRIFGDSKSFRIQANILIAVLSLWLLTSFLISMLLCRPFHYNWNLTSSSEHCGFNGDQTTPFKALAAVNIVTDIATIALPVSQIYDLSIPLKKRMGLVFMFGMGIL